VGIGGSIVIAFLLSPFLIHTLGDTNYGVWSVIAALTGYMALLDLGVSSAVAKYVSKYKALDDYPSLNKVMNTALLLLLCVSVLLVVVSPLLSSGMVRFFGFEDELANTVGKLIIVASVDIAIFVATNVLVGAYYGFQRYEIINAVNLTVAIGKALAFYWALSNGHGLLAMGVISLLCNVIVTTLLFLVLKKIEPGVRLNPAGASKATAFSIYDYSKYTFLSMLAMQLVYYSDAFVIGYFLSAAAITIYTIPWSLSEYTNKLMLAVTQTFVPVFSEQDATEGSQVIYNTYITGTKFMLVLSNLVCLGVLANGDFFIALWMGEKYAVQCSAILAILFTTQLIKGPQLLSYSILLGTSNHKRYSYYNFGFSILNLILSILLVQKFGLVGVAAGTAITQITLYGIVTPVLTLRAINASLLGYLKKTYFRILPSSALLFVLLKYLSTLKTPDSYAVLLGQAGVAAFVYLVSVYFTLLDSDERQIINSGGKKVLARVF
jgi:O-antigen/teichoic acid export membrane protein